MEKEERDRGDQLMINFLKIVGILEIVASTVLAIVALVDKQYMLCISLIFNLVGGIALFILGVTKEDTENCIFTSRENTKRIANLEKLLSKNNELSEHIKEEASFRWVRFSSADKLDKQDN